MLVVLSDPKKGLECRLLICEGSTFEAGEASGAQILGWTHSSAPGVSPGHQQGDRRESQGSVPWLPLWATGSINPIWGASKELYGASPVAQKVEKWGRPGFNPWVGKNPWRREWQPTLEFLPENSVNEEPGGLQSVGSQRVRHDWVTDTFTFHRAL